uniref:Uncharacterized protein n=1 Tax=Globodera rostochiensis TaxID=31243 RepID=A0A914I6V6_GLORO
MAAIPSSNNNCLSSSSSSIIFKLFNAFVHLLLPVLHANRTLGSTIAAVGHPIFSTNHRIKIFWSTTATTVVVGTDVQQRRPNNANIPL